MYGTQTTLLEDWHSISHHMTGNTSSTKPNHFNLSAKCNITVLENTKTSVCVALKMKWMEKYLQLPYNKKYPTWIAIAPIHADIQKHTYTNYGIVRDTTAEQKKVKLDR